MTGPGSPRDCAVFATMGAGKTRMALRIARQAMAARGVRRIIVVVHSEYLLKKWKEDAAAFGLELIHWENHDGESPPSDVHGLLVTYTQIGFFPDLHRLLAHAVPTLVIFDEIHHAGDQEYWGKHLREAYAPAAYRLLLSGTPIRTDGSLIAFLNEKTPVFRYSYGEAITDGLCRMPGIQTFEGALWWLDEQKERKEASFGQRLSERDQRRRLISALRDTDGWMKQVLVDANRLLTMCREGEGGSDDGGIVFASDVDHVDEIVALLDTLCPGEVISVTYEDPDALDQIDHFAAGRGRWIVCIKKIGEGLHLDRLRVGVFASTTATELFFRQAYGRVVVCRDENDEAPAYFFVPKDPTLLQYARRLEEEIPAPEIDEEAEPGGGGSGAGPRQWVPGGGQAYRDDFIGYTATFTPEELRRAQEVKAQSRVRARLEDVAAILRAAGMAGSGQPGSDYQTGSTPSATRADQSRSALRRLAHALTAKYHDATGAPYDHINERLKQLTGAYIRGSSIAQLKQRIALIEQWLKKL